MVEDVVRIENIGDGIWLIGLSGRLGTAKTKVIAKIEKCKSIHRFSTDRHFDINFI
jgi:hypothetical protein